MLVVSVALRVPQGEQDRFLAITRPLVEMSRQEAGVIAYSFAVDMIDKDLFRIFELYKDRASLDAHMASDHFKHWRAQSGAYERSERHILETF